MLCYLPNKGYFCSLVSGLCQYTVYDTVLATVVNANCFPLLHAALSIIMFWGALSISRGLRS
jgi:hypothetical protein